MSEDTLLKSMAPRTHIRQGVELGFAVGLRLMRTLCGPKWAPNVLLIQTTPASPLSTYKKLPGVLPRFNAAENTIVFAADWLTRPVSDSDPELRRLMQQQLQSLDNVYRDEIPDWVTQLIRGLLAQGDATLYIIASHLGLGARTLQQALQ
ncbi:hypothetical protein CD175_14685 [Pseudomonas laurylsulfatiphila]|uniref:HTH-type transcriptional regulator AraC-type N-terminal domain-containing protein n=1 Tax=Pseudomonas laurylsulfatiphila TaxID=2011015 RepID=A0A2S6FJI3_9PSED|nr:hypothetical protein CD175_14685 [Pseudomonas laurylsulfatiphila]